LLFTASEQGRTCGPLDQRLQEWRTFKHLGIDERWINQCRVMLDGKESLPEHFQIWHDHVKVMEDPIRFRVSYRLHIADHNTLGQFG